MKNKLISWNSRYGLTSIHLLVLASLYCIVLTVIISAANGMPFVMDGNETYSSIVHAHSISEFGISQSWGLADEAYGIASNAHPYVHSHQGNYPRIFAWLISKLGASDVFLQVVVTTFTIGLGSFLLAYLFLRRVSNNWTAFVCCIFLLSDYLFFAQWQLVTYRVWYTFVFFVQFYLIECYVAKRSLRTLIILFANTALFCYGELIFAAFLGLFTLSWLIYKSWPSLVIMRNGALAMAGGLFVSLLLLFLQGISYLGMDNFLLDLYYTFGARNSFNASNGSLDKIAEFYRNNHVVFWENIQSRDSFMSVNQMLNSIFGPFIEIYSPLALLFLIFPAIIILAPLKPFHIVSHQIERLFQRYVKFMTWGDLLRYTLAGFASIVIVNASDNYILHFYNFALSGFEILAIGISVSAVTVAIAQHSFLVLFRYVSAAVIFYCIAYIFQAIDVKAFEPLWVFEHGTWIVKFVPFILLISAAAMSILACAESSSRSLASINYNRQSDIVDLLWFIGLGISAYVIVYYLSPGYLYSGYTVRLAPFLVYVLDVALAFLFFYGLRLVVNCFKLRTINPSFSIASIFVTLSISLWINQQYVSTLLFVPSHYDVLAKLGSEPYRNSTFVVNTYAAPVAVQTGSWAYFDPAVSMARFVNVGGKRKLLGDRRYLWLADRDQNSLYRRPDYYICMIPQDIENRLTIVRDGYSSGCLDVPLVRLASKSDKNSNDIRLVDYDKKGQQTGLVSWAIVKFDWDNGLGGGLAWNEESHVEQAKGTGIYGK